MTIHLLDLTLSKRTTESSNPLLSIFLAEEYERPVNLPPALTPNTHHCTDDMPDPQREGTLTFPFAPAPNTKPHLLYNH